MAEETRRLTDTELAQILESSPPPPPDEYEERRNAETLRTCPLCEGHALVTLKTAETYRKLVEGVPPCDR